MSSYGFILFPKTLLIIADAKITLMINILVFKFIALTF
jgi:hypothetical protein